MELCFFFFFSSRRRHTRFDCDWSSDVCSSDLNTALPQVWWGNPGLGFLDNVHRQGAGMVRIDDAVEADAIVSPSSLALGEIETGSVTKRLRISADDGDDHRDH